MDTGKIIEGIETRMFDPSYFSALKTSYSNQVSAGYFETEEKEYVIEPISTFGVQYIGFKTKCKSLFRIRLGCISESFLPNNPAT